MKRPTPRKRISLLQFISSLVAVSLLFITCNDEKEHEPDVPKSPKINCVILSRAQLQAWVDSGWTKPGTTDQINEVILQFFGTNGGSSLRLIGYPGTGATSVRSSGKITLVIDTTCTVKPFTGDVIFGNNILKFDNLGIFNREGGLNKFDYVRLTPEQMYPPYVNFKVEVVNREQGSGEDGETLPCPDHCPPPTSN